MPSQGGCAPQCGGALAVGTEQTPPWALTRAPCHPGIKPQRLFFSVVHIIAAMDLAVSTPGKIPGDPAQPRGRAKSSFLPNLLPQRLLGSMQGAEPSHHWHFTREQHPCPTGRVPGWAPTVSPLPPGPDACKHCFTPPPPLFFFLLFSLVFFFPLPPLGKQAQRTVHSSSPRSP